MSEIPTSGHPKGPHEWKLAVEAIEKVSNHKSEEKRLEQEPREIEAQEFSTFL